MAIKRMVILAALALGVAGCATVDTASRNAPLSSQIVAPGEVQVVRNYSLQDVVVQVPRDLRVSESGGYYPMADIVWRGDAIGDRHQQVGTLFQEAGLRASAELNGDIPVVAVITLNRFHGVTERTRYSVGGVYNMEFQLTIQHALTGVILEEPRFIEANLPAPGGQAAVELERIGQTERVRVTDYLTFVLRREIGAGFTPGAPEPIEEFL
jgi:hypothetical protein